MSFTDPAPLREDLDGWLEELNDRAPDAVIVVEGPKDERALLRLGVIVPIAVLNQGKGIGDALASIAGSNDSKGAPHRTVIILTDWDRKGGQLANRIMKACLNLNIPFDNDARRKLAFLTGKWIRDVESLDTLVMKLDADKAEGSFIG